MAAVDPGERGSADRLQFLDAVRGFALLLMIASHTGRWWQDGAMGWPRYNLIYATMAVGAPLCLGVAAKLLQRGAKLVLAGWALNLVVFRDEPFWEGGVLQTIGLGIILALPPMLILHRRVARYLLVAFALAFLRAVLDLPLEHRGLAAQPSRVRAHLLLRIPPVAVDRHRVDRALAGLGLRAPGHPSGATATSRA
jgi:hypothetical protein